jgi:hypothetical protein
MAQRTQTFVQVEISFPTASFPSKKPGLRPTWPAVIDERRKGQRLRIGVPHGHWKTTTFVAGLRLSGMVAPMVLDGPINGAAFQA